MHVSAYLRSTLYSLYFLQTWLLLCGGGLFLGGRFEKEEVSRLRPLLDGLMGQALEAWSIE